MSDMNEERDLMDTALVVASIIAFALFTYAVQTLLERRDRRLTGT